MLVSFRTCEKLDRPFRDPTTLHVNVLSLLWFVDVFQLKYQCNWIVGPFVILRELKCLGIVGEREVVIITIIFIQCASGRTAPHAILKYPIPNVTASSK